MANEKQASGMSKFRVALTLSIMWVAVITSFAAWLDKVKNFGGRPLYFGLGALAFGGAVIIATLISKE